MSVKVNNLLSRLITGSEGSRLTCIIDDSTKRIGLELFKKFISNSPNQGGRLLLLDNPVNCFNIDPAMKLHVTQCLGTSIIFPDELEMLKSIPSGHELYIDSLTPLFILHFDQFYNIILDLKRKFTRIIALVSLETCSSRGLPIINDLAESIINVTPIGSDYEAIIYHKKPSSRLGVNLIKLKETFNIINGKFAYSKLSDTPLVNERKEPTEQTIENLPFNLRSADEDTLVKRTSNTLNLKSSGGEGGKVYYEPGKEDDVDEEDPDEDLLI